MKKLLIILLSCITPLLHAGSPISRQANGQPRVHLTDAPLIWRMDPNDLSAIWTNAEVTAIVAEEFADWMAVPGTSLVLEQGPVLESDPLSQDDILDLLNAGVNPIVLDDTGSVFEDFGFTGSGALAFAGAFWNDQDPTGPLLVMLAVIGGPGTGPLISTRRMSNLATPLVWAIPRSTVTCVAARPPNGKTPASPLSTAWRSCTGWKSTARATTCTPMISPAITIFMVMASPATPIQARSAAKCCSPMALPAPMASTW